MSDYLLEIGCEEIPARFMGPVLEDLRGSAGALLRGARLQFGEARTYGTPRRLALLVTGLAEKQQPLIQEIKGPARKVAFNAAGKPTPAAVGFARGQGVEVDSLVIKTLGPVEYVYARKEEAGRNAREVLAEMAPDLVRGLHFARPMRWGGGDFKFVRPIRWIVSLLDADVVGFELGGQAAGRITYGHRFLGGGPLELGSPGEYLDRLRENRVLADQDERKALIRRQVQDAARDAGGVAEMDEELLEEVTQLVEYPAAFAGKIELAYLNLPREVLITPMKEHQRYFPVADARGNLLPQFIGVRNGTADHIEVVREGNEKVLRARLADAAFFWQEDLKLPLAGKVDQLKKIVWQENMGTMYEKTLRLAALAGEIARALKLDGRMKAVVDRAAFLCKADLVTSMVYEFTELQGAMGREYALRSGEDRAVAEALFEHYLPRFAGDDLPSSMAGIVLSLADKFDNLVGCFAAGKEPTGSQDPYALRRQALGICGILLEGNLSISTGEIIDRAYSLFEAGFSLKASRETVAASLGEFFKQRLKGILIDRGYSYDIVDAVLAAGCDDLPGAASRAGSLQRFKAEPVFEAVITAFTRAHNLSRNFESTTVSTDLLIHPAEESLYRMYLNVRESTGAMYDRRDYDGVLHQFALLREPVDVFFDAVMVMVKETETRENRLALLRSISMLTRPLADLNRVVVG